MTSKLHDKRNMQGIRNVGCGREATIRQLVIGGVNKDWPVPKRVRSYMTLQ